MKWGDKKKQWIKINNHRIINFVKINVESL